MAKTKASVKNPVTNKLGEDAMEACRKAAKRADKKCDGDVTPLICYIICSKLRNTAPPIGKTYSHGIVDVSYFSRWLASRGLSVYVPDRKSTHSSSKSGKLGNDVDRLFHELERLGLVIRYKSTYRWGNLRVAAARTTNDAKQSSNELDQIEAVFSSAKSSTKRKAKRCDDCEMVLSKCICEDIMEEEEEEEESDAGDGEEDNNGEGEEDDED